MKICIPTKTNKGKQAEVYEHFGSAPYFTIYDLDSGTIEIIKNSNQHHSHGMCRPMDELSDKKIDAVVCGGMGLRAIQKLNENGIKAYKTLQGTVENLAQEFLNSKLDEITLDNACSQHEHGCH